MSHNPDSPHDCHSHDHCGHEHCQHEHGVHLKPSPAVTKTVKCPKCGASVQTRIVTTIRPDETGFRELFAGTLNRPTCPSCHAMFLVDETLTYCEEDSPFIVYQMEEPEDGDASRQLENEVDAMATDIFQKENLARPTVRLVFDRPDLLEKIAIHKLGFDDRLIEYAKLQLYRSLEDPQLSRTEHKLMFDFTHTDDEKLIFLIFHKETLKPINAIQVPMDEYKSLEHSLLTDEDVQKELDALFPGCYVSAERML